MRQTTEDCRRESGMDIILKINVSMMPFGVFSSHERLAAPSAPSPTMTCVLPATTAANDVMSEFDYEMQPVQTP